MAEDWDVLAKAREATLALSSTATLESQGKALEILVDLLDLLEVADHVHAAGAYLRGYRPVDGMVCRVCKRVMTNEDPHELKSLLRMVEALKDHECAPEVPDPLMVARKAMQDAYKDAVGMNVFDLKSKALLDATLNYVHVVVKAERDRVRGTTREVNEVMDRVVELTDPQQTGLGT